MEPSLIPVRQDAAGATFAVKVQPRARRNAVTGMVGHALKVAVTAPPEAGRANHAVIGLLAELLNLPRSSVTIASGAGSRDKRVRVTGISAPELEARITRAFDSKH
jgi:uncharacterized protein (TIGR00251 family)